MPITLQCEEIPLTNTEVESLWSFVCEERTYPDEAVAIRCVSEQEIQELNKKYRQKDSPTNVLTFSYGEGEHDIALCNAVAKREAKERGAIERDYTALLITHALLHATNMDHEHSEEEAKRQREAEQRILERAGFSAAWL